MTQGDPLVMFIYSIGILPMIKNLKAKFPGITQLWYDDNSGALGTFARVESCFNLLKLFGLERRYYSEPFKSVLIVHPENPEYRKSFGFPRGFKVCMGARYLGSFIGDDESKRDCLKNRIKTWDQNIHTICKNLGKYTQGSSATVQSNWSGYLYNASKIIQYIRLRECRRLFRKNFRLAFLFKSQNIYHPW